MRPHTGIALACAIILSVASMLPASGQAPPAGTVPLCAGLTVVTAVNDPAGDYESIKTVLAVTDTDVRLRYSTERMVSDAFSAKPPQLTKFTLPRTVRRGDLQSAFLYEQQFSTELPETIPETTAIGTSAAVLNALKTKGEAKLGIFIAYTQNKPGIDRGVHPNVYDNQMVATVKRVGTTTVPIPVIVNDVPTTLPAIQAAGDFFGDKSEFFFLDDPANPLALKFRFGIGGVQPLDPVTATLCANTKDQLGPMLLGGARCDMPNGGDKDTLRVIKITYRCSAPAAASAGNAPGAGQMAGGGPGPAASAGANALEQSLAKTGKVDVYSIYFSFNSDVIREESEPTLRDIADVMKRHPDWRLAVNGHTDGIGGDQANLDLSKRRSAAVKDALVKRYSVDAPRLVTSGFGKSQPKDTNDTIEGRAHNRRVELIRQ